MSVSNYEPWIIYQTELLTVSLRPFQIQPEDFLSETQTTSSFQNSEKIQNEWSWKWPKLLAHYYVLNKPFTKMYQI